MQQQLTPQQIVVAAAAGTRLLQEKDLPVPMEIAKGGSLGVLEQILGAIANGQLVVMQAPEQQPEGPQLTAVEDAEEAS